MKNKILAIILCISMMVALFIPMVVVSAEDVQPGKIVIDFGAPYIGQYNSMAVPVNIVENTGDIFVAKFYFESLQGLMAVGWTDGTISDTDTGGIFPTNFALTGLFNSSECSVTTERTLASNTSSTGLRTTGLLGTLLFYKADGTTFSEGDDLSQYKFAVGEGSKVVSIHNDSNGDPIIHEVLHNHTPYKSTVADPDGCKQEVCTYCGEVFAKIDHKYTNYVYQDDAKCGVDGNEIAECDNGCGTTDKRAKADTALEHSYTNYVYQNDAQCGVNGTEKAECDNGCGTPDVRAKDGTALQHSYTNYVYQNDAKCGVDGNEKAECDNGCGNTDVRAKAGTALEHSYTDYTYNEDAVCGEDGTKTAECDHGCGQKDTIKADGTALVHKYTNYVSNGDAECGVDGTKTAECDHGCGEKDTVADTGSALEHSYTDYTYNNDAKCGVDGTETAECDHGCGNKDTRAKIGTALQHDMVKDEENYKDAECGVPGVDAKICSRGCGHKESTPITALEHEYTNYVNNKDATTEKDGTATAECDNGCGTKDTQTIVGSKLVTIIDKGGLTIKTETGKEIPGDTYIVPSDAEVDEDSIKGYDPIINFTFAADSSEEAVKGIEAELTFDLEGLEVEEYETFTVGVIGADGKVTIVDGIKVEGGKLTMSGALDADYIFLGVLKSTESDTSDSFNAALYIVIALAAVAGIAVIGKKRFAL